MEKSTSETKVQTKTGSIDALYTKKQKLSAAREKSTIYERQMMTQIQKNEKAVKAAETEVNDVIVRMPHLRTRPVTQRIDMLENKVPKLLKKEVSTGKRRSNSISRNMKTKGGVDEKKGSFGRRATLSKVAPSRIGDLKDGNKITKQKTDKVNPSKKKTHKIMKLDDNNNDLMKTADKLSENNENELLVNKHNADGFQTPVKRKSTGMVNNSSIFSPMDIERHRRFNLFHQNFDAEERENKPKTVKTKNDNTDDGTLQVSDVKQIKRKKSTPSPKRIKETEKQGHVILNVARTTRTFKPPTLNPARVSTNPENSSLNHNRMKNNNFGNRNSIFPNFDKNLRMDKNNDDLNETNSINTQNKTSKANIQKAKESVQSILNDNSSSVISFQNGREKRKLHVSQPIQVHIDVNAKNQKYNLIDDLYQVFGEAIKNKCDILNSSKTNSSIIIDSSKMKFNEDFKSNIFIEISDLFNKESLSCHNKTKIEKIEQEHKIVPNNDLEKVDVELNSNDFGNRETITNDILQKYNIGKETNSFFYQSTSTIDLNENLNQKSQMKNNISRNDTSIDDFLTSNSSDIFLNTINETQIKDDNDSSNKDTNNKLTKSDKKQSVDDKYDYSESDDSNILKFDASNNEKRN